MNRAFLETYERELAILYERSKLFAEAYPGIADRLGGLTEDRADPHIVALLQGCAFLAARVQLKLTNEYAEFTSTLLEQLLPNYLAPIPSVALVRATPVFSDPDLIKGRTFPAGATLDSAYTAAESKVTCRYVLTEDLTLWPLVLAEAVYHASPAPLHGLGLEVAEGTGAGLRLTFELPAADGGDGGRRGPGLADCPLDRLPVRLVGGLADATALYEQIFADCRRVSIRTLDAYDRPRFTILKPGSVEQIGFDQPGTVFGADDRLFTGFELLREFFLFPRKFAGFVLNGLKAALTAAETRRFDVLFEFGAPKPWIAPRVDAAQFAIHTAPVVNLFPMACSRIPVRSNEHEHQVVPDRSRAIDFEAHRILDVHAHFAGSSRRVPVRPLYGAGGSGVGDDQGLTYTLRRRPRAPTLDERRFGALATYAGSEIFLQIGEPTDVGSDTKVRELSVRALVSNRHLPEKLPTGLGASDFFFVDDAAIRVDCVERPTPPRDALVRRDQKPRSDESTGTVLWKLVNLLTLNHLTLMDDDPEVAAGRLRELMALFVDQSDVVTDRRIRGLKGVETRSVVRRLRQGNGFNAARGIEITLRFDETAFEGAGIALLGAALDRFFAEYTSINSFTQTVIASLQRGVIMRWPPRGGRGRPL